MFGTCYIQVLYLGRTPHTKETLPDFQEKCRVTRHSRVFRGLTGSQRTPKNLGRHIFHIISCIMFFANFLYFHVHFLSCSYTVHVSYTFICHILSYNLSYTFLYFYLHSYTFHIRYFCMLSSGTFHVLYFHMLSYI